MQDHDLPAVRRLALGDLFFLLVCVFGRADINRDWLFDRAREVQAEPDGCLDLWSREHYKSTIITYGLTIQDILNNPELTVGIFSHTRPIAKKFLRQIKQEFENNELLKLIFPDIIHQKPQSEALKWSEDNGIVVKRRTNPKEATVEAWGLVDGQPIGAHYGLMVFDDVVTRASVTTPEMIEKTTDAWELAQALSSDGGRIRHVGTRYHYNDTYKTIIDRKAAKVRLYPGTDNGMPDGKPVLFSQEYLEKKRRDMGNYTFACQILQNPRADVVDGFDENWLLFWPAQHHRGLNTYILVDPANEKKKRSDYTSMWCVGYGEDENFMVVDMLRDRLNLEERTRVLMAWHRDYRPLRVGYEKYGMQADIEHIKYVQKQENYRFPIIALGGQMAKNDRIRQLIPLFKDGRVFLPERCIKADYEGVQHDLVRVFINDEYNAFPVPLHDDMLDSLARIQDPDFPIVAPRKVRRRSRVRRDYDEFAA